MSPSSDSPMIPSDEDAVRRRRIGFRAWHRGTREMDLIMGRFADAELAGLDAAGLDSFEALMEQPDPELYKWVSGEAPVPADVDAAFLGRIRDFHTRTGALRGPMEMGASLPRGERLTGSEAPLSVGTPRG